MSYQRLADWINRFYKSKISYLFVFTLLFLVSILQVVAFIYWNTGISFFWDSTDKIIYSGDSNAWIAYLIFTLSFLGYYFTIASFILVVNHNRNYIWYVIVGETFLICLNILLGLFFTLFTNILFILIPIINLKEWDKEKDQKFRKNLDKKGWLIHFFFTFIYFACVFPMAFFLFNESLKNSIFDTVGSSILISAWFLITKKNSIGFIEFMLSDFIYIVLFILLNVWTSSMSYMIFLLFDIMVLISVGAQKEKRTVSNQK